MLSLPRQRLLGLALLAALWAGALAAQPMTMVQHMVVHLGVVGLVPALMDPPPLALRGPVALALGVLAEMAAVWGWHLPAAHHFAATLPGLVIEQLSFLAVGLLLWSAVRGAGALGGAVALLGTVMHMTLLGALIGLAPRTIYLPWVICGGSPTLDPLTQQQLAGALMAVGGGAIYLAAGLSRLSRVLTLTEESP